MKKKLPSSKAEQADTGEVVSDATAAGDGAGAAGAARRRSFHAPGGAAGAFKVARVLGRNFPLVLLLVMIGALFWPTDRQELGRREAPKRRPEDSRRPEAETHPSIRYLPPRARQQMPPVRQLRHAATHVGHPRPKRFNAGRRLTVTNLPDRAYGKGESRRNCASVVYGRSLIAAANSSATVSARAPSSLTWSMMPSAFSWAPSLMDCDSRTDLVGP